MRLIIIHYPITGTLGVTLIADHISVAQGFFVEVIATFVLVLTIFATCDRLRGDHSGSAGLAIGFVVTMDIPWAVSTAVNWVGRSERGWFGRWLLKVSTSQTRVCSDSFTCCH